MLYLYTYYKLYTYTCIMYMCKAVLLSVTSKDFPINHREYIIRWYIKKNSSM